MSGAASVRLGLDVSAVPAQLTGAGVYTFELARALRARDDLELSIFARRSDGPRWAALSPAVLRAVAPDSRPGRLAFGELGLGKELRRPGGPELLHGPHYTMPLRPPVPVVVTVHDLTLIEHPEWHQRSKVLYFQRAIRHTAWRATRIICVSEQTAARLRELCPPRCPVEVIPHGVDHLRFTPGEPNPGADQEVLDRLGLKGRYLLHLGTVEPRKNLLTLVAAFDELAGNEEDLTLALAGMAGWGSAQLNGAIARSRHGARVRRLGYVASADTPALLRRAAVVVYPSKEEGFGLPALEALACGTALVTSADSVMSELAGEAAWCVDAADASALASVITSALAGQDARRALGLARAATFTWAATAARHVEVYRHALE